MRFLKIALTFSSLVIITQIVIGQSNDDIMKLWNSETARIGDRIKDRIDSEIQNTQSELKQLSSSDYSKGLLEVYRHDEKIKKIDKAYTKADVNYIESYYMNGSWPSYIELRNSSQPKPDKFYFDKGNLMLWIDSNEEQYTLKNKKCKDWWRALINSTDKLVKAANSDAPRINEDKIKLSVPEPLTKEDSLELLKIQKEIDKIMKQLPDSIKY